MKLVRLIIVLLVCLVAVSASNAQDSSHLRISIITCGPGLDLYSGFGHSGVRIIDSTSRYDIVYNYGTFDFGDPDFYWKFTRGKLLYYVNKESYHNFLSTYLYEGRFVYEQVLALNAAQKYQVKGFLENNAKEENKYYPYDFLYDNCSTRIRDIFSTLFKGQFKLGLATTSDSISFRNRTDYYLRNNHWTRFGIDLLLSTPVDKKMTNEQSMFLPDYLMEGFRTASLYNQPFVAETIQILPNKVDFKDTPNRPKLIMWLLLLGAFLLSISVKHKRKMIYFDILFFLLIGLLGSFMLFMWFGTDHQSCAYNRNLLWALPTHLIFALFITRKPLWLRMYAQFSMSILLAALVWNLWAAQVYIAEITPVILLLLWRLNHYRKNHLQNNSYARFRTMFSSFQQG